MMFGAISKYDALATSNPNLATSLISLSTYTCAELVRQSFDKKAQRKQKQQSLISIDETANGAPLDDVAINGGVTNGHGTKPAFNLRSGVSGIILMGLLGFLVHGPWITFWFSLLEKIFPNRNPIDITSKIILDQAVGCPIYYVLLGMATGLAEGHGFRGTARRVRDDMWAAVRLSWVAWPMLHAVNFAFVPLKRRRLLIQAGGLLWAIFLCTLTAKEDMMISAMSGGGDQVKLLPEDEEKLKIETCPLSAAEILAEDDNVTASKSDASTRFGRRLTFRRRSRVTS